MNSLDALSAAAKAPAPCGRHPGRPRRISPPGRLVRLLAEHEPAPAPLHLLFQPSRLASPEIRAFVDYLVERWHGADPFGTRRDAGMD